MLHSLLFALWFQDKQAIQVQYTAGNHSMKMATDYICVCVFLNLMTLFYVIIEKL